MQYEPKFDIGQKVYLYIPVTTVTTEEEESQKWYLTFDLIEAILIEKEGNKIIYNYQVGQIGWYKEDSLFETEAEAEGKSK